MKISLPPLFSSHSIFHINKVIYLNKKNIYAYINNTHIDILYYIGIYKYI